MQTRAPIYGRFAPVSWLMERDILDGRRHMNLSSVGHLLRRSAADPQGEDRAGGEDAQNATAAVSNDPLEHAHHRRRRAGLHPLGTRDPAQLKRAATADRRRRSDSRQRGLREALHRLPCAGAKPRRAELQGVYGRTSGTVPGFPYSDALKKANIVWNRDIARAMAHRSRTRWFPATTWTSTSPSPRSAAT